MPQPKRQFTGILLKPIYLDAAKSRVLHAVLAVPADDADKLAHIEAALRAMRVALDKFFGLKSYSPYIWQRRAKEFITREFNIAPDHPQWWRALTITLRGRIFLVRNLGLRRDHAVEDRPDGGKVERDQDRRLVGQFGKTDHARAKGPLMTFVKTCSLRLEWVVLAL